MNILHLSYGHLNNPWIMGGTPIRVHEINKRLVDRHEVTVLTGVWPGAPKHETIDGVWYQHVGSPWSYVLSRLSYAHKAYRVAHFTDADLVVEDFSNFTPCFAGLWPRRPTLAIVHHLSGWHAVRSHRVLGLAGWAYERTLLRTHRHMLTVSESVAATIRREVKRPVSIATVHNGVDESLIDLRTQEDPYLLFLGRHEPHMKGLDLLIEGFAPVSKRHRKLSLVVAGFGGSSVTQSLVRRAHLNGQVDVRGAISESEKRELLRRCLAVVMPSRYEGWGIVAIEAAACGKPVIGQRVTGLVDSVRDGETGILVPYEDVDALAAAINRIVEDDELRHRMGAAGRKWARNFSWDEAARQQEEFYCKVLEAES